MQMQHGLTTAALEDVIRNARVEMLRSLVAAGVDPARIPDFAAKMIPSANTVHTSARRAFLSGVSPPQHIRALVRYPVKCFSLHAAALRRPVVL